MYDDRDECYTQYILAVELATRWQQRYDLKLKAMQKLEGEKKTLLQIQQMTDEEFARFQKDVTKLEKALKRNKMLVWILIGYGAAVTVVAAVGLAM